VPGVLRSREGVMVKVVIKIVRSTLEPALEYKREAVNNFKVLHQRWTERPQSIISVSQLSSLNSVN
jgi:hypothetical protein